MRGPAVSIIAAAVVMVVGMVRGAAGPPSWCIARSGTGATALQAALDYACGSGVADCAPVQPSGTCYLPNTLSSHASYAFNSYYQRSSAAPGACDFAGTATVTVTDPSYGSCSYPSSASTAGGSTSTPNTNTPSNTPGTTFTPPTTPAIGGGGTGSGGGSGVSPPGFGFGSTIPDDTSTVSPLRPALSLATLLLLHLTAL
ncbi:PLASMODESMATA CALLOSE-BINDING PROTEIN 3-like [Canna indica]|uniref:PLASMODESMATA CALLOSE-BINDING PROTEIN 3-like n=1 Tax=Canna indica TaxID=4628 RepID=A0AAQ3QM77_9LILI|nr:PLASMODESMATA CALLOSE-BINDING PROTEIN 3-like [Canna indica]